MKKEVLKFFREATDRQLIDILYTVAEENPSYIETLLRQKNVNASVSGDLKEIRVFDICIKLSEIQHNRILDAYKHVGKVQAIKDLRLMTDLGLKDAKDVVEQYFIPLSDRLRHDTGARSLGDLLRDQINGG